MTPHLEQRLQQIAAENGYSWPAGEIAAAMRQAAEAALEWLPIDSAPKDFNTVFDGWNGSRVADVTWDHPDGSPKGHMAWCVSEYQSGWGWVSVEVRGLTRWRPLPPPPKEPHNDRD